MVEIVPVEKLNGSNEMLCFHKESFKRLRFFKLLLKHT
jgi:hypothetical protein